MPEANFVSLADRLKTAADAKKALLAQFRPKPAVSDPSFDERSARQAAERDQMRTARAEAKASKRQALLDAKEAVLQQQADAETAALEAKRGERKERKALTKAEAKTKRDARYAARKARLR